MINYIFTYEDGILYKDGVKVDMDQKEKTAKIKYDYNTWNVYCENCKHSVDITDEYCIKCGSKLEFNAEENQKFINEYDKQVTHPYGWPLTKEQIVFSIGKPVYIEKLNGDMVWKIVNKIEINENGYNINFTDGSWHLFHELNIYDPTNIVKNKLYPFKYKEKESTISKVSINDTIYNLNCKCNKCNE